jgi:hypothetical protein
VEFDLSALSPRTASLLDLLYPLTREGMLKSALQDYHAQRQAMSRFSLAALLLSEPMLKLFRRELRRLSPEVSVNLQEIRTVLAGEVLKREVVEGEKAEEARKKIQRVLKRQARQARIGMDGVAEETEEEVPTLAEEQKEEVAASQEEDKLDN